VDVDWLRGSLSWCWLVIYIRSGRSGGGGADLISVLRTRGMRLSLHSTPLHSTPLHSLSNSITRSGSGRKCRARSCLLTRSQGVTTSSWRRGLMCEEVGGCPASAAASSVVDGSRDLGFFRRSLGPIWLRKILNGAPRRDGDALIFSLNPTTHKTSKGRDSRSMRFNVRTRSISRKSWRR